MAWGTSCSWSSQEQPSLLEIKSRRRHDGRLRDIQLMKDELFNYVRLTVKSEVLAKSGTEWAKDSHFAERAGIVLETSETHCKDCRLLGYSGRIPAETTIRIGGVGLTDKSSSHSDISVLSVRRARGLKAKKSTDKQSLGDHEPKKIDDVMQRKIEVEA